MISQYSTSEASCSRDTILVRLIWTRIFNRQGGFTKDPVTYSVGTSNAMTMTIPIDAHKAKRQVLDPVFSKRRINMMEAQLYEEIDRVLFKINQYHTRDEEVPIHELFYCYTVSVVICIHIPRLTIDRRTSYLSCYSARA
jgi:hypothetical protein